MYAHARTLYHINILYTSDTVKIVSVDRMLTLNVAHQQLYYAWAQADLEETRQTEASSSQREDLVQLLAQYLSTGGCNVPWIQS